MHKVECVTKNGQKYVYSDIDDVYVLTQSMVQKLYEKLKLMKFEFLTADKCIYFYKYLIFSYFHYLNWWYDNSY